MRVTAPPATGETADPQGGADADIGVGAGYEEQEHGGFSAATAAQIQTSRARKHCIRLFLL